MRKPALLKCTKQRYRSACVVLSSLLLAWIVCPLEVKRFTEISVHRDLDVSVQFTIRFDEDLVRCIFL